MKAFRRKKPHKTTHSPHERPGTRRAFLLAPLEQRPPLGPGVSFGIECCETWQVIMSQQTIVKPRAKVKAKAERPKLWKVILLNDDFTPRDFVVTVLKAVFGMNQARAYSVMMTAHQKGACVIAVFTKDVADTKAKEATELGKSNGYPLFFTTEPEE
jgi:ATP-dependent Clp protease adaptor protein ClpS